jgi:hypothetical protein
VRYVAPLLCSLSLVVSLEAGADAASLPPVLDELAAPFSESQAGGIGCLVGVVAAGGAMTYMLGGVGPALASLSAPLPAARVLEGGAAAAFVFSSACYVGVALAPLAMLAYTSVIDSLAGIPGPGGGVTLAQPQPKAGGGPAAAGFGVTGGAGGAGRQLR